MVWGFGHDDAPLHGSHKGWFRVQDWGSRISVWGVGVQRGSLIEAL